MVNTSKKYEEILSTARDLFWKHGFRRISIEEVCRKAGVSKMTFYRFFPNKLELARCVFDHEAQKGFRDFRNIMNEDIKPAEKIKKMLQLKFKGSNDISREFLMDFYNSPELGLKEHIEETGRKIWTEIMADFKKAQETGIFRKDFKPEFILYVTQKMTELMNDEKITGMFDSPQDMIMELTNFFVFGISPHE
jgi:AcrR family transcriptional regulator